MQDSKPTFKTVPALARESGVSERHIRQAIADGRLRAIPKNLVKRGPGNRPRYLVDVASFEALVNGVANSQKFSDPTAPRGRRASRPNIPQHV